MCRCGPHTRQLCRRIQATKIPAVRAADMAADVSSYSLCVNHTAAYLAAIKQGVHHEAALNREIRKRYEAARGGRRSL